MPQIVKSFELSDIECIGNIWNEHILGVPFCYPVEAEEFKKAFWMGEDAQDQEERLFTCTTGGKLLGFSHVTLGQFEADGKKQNGGLIRFLTYQRGFRSVGQALLEESENCLRSLDCSRIDAFPLKHGYPFHQFTVGTLSDRMGHITGLLGVNGYRPHDGQLGFERVLGDIGEPALPDLGVEIRVEKAPGLGILPDIKVRPFHGDQSLGMCESLSAVTYAKREELEQYCYTTWIAVKPEEQGKGLGRYLLQRSLWEMQEAGYKRAILGTRRMNHRALLLYIDLGYKIVDTTYAYLKDIEE